MSDELELLVDDLVKTLFFFLKKSLSEDKKDTSSSSSVCLSAICILIHIVYICIMLKKKIECEHIY